MTIADSRVVAFRYPDARGRFIYVPGNVAPYPDAEPLIPLSLLAEAERERDQALREADNLHRGCADLVEQNLALQSRLDAALSTSGVDRALSATVGGEIVLSFITAQDECTAEEIIQSALRAALGCATTGEGGE